MEMETANSTIDLEAATRQRIAAQEAYQRAEANVEEAKGREQAAVRVAAVDLARARAAEKAAEADEFQAAINKLEPEYRRSVEVLSRAIQAAADANAEVAQLYGAASQLANGKGIPIPMLHWPELLPETATRATKLSAWRRQVMSYLETSLGTTKASSGARVRLVRTLVRGAKPK